MAALIWISAASRLLLPASFLILLPIAHRVSLGLRRLPFSPRPGDRLLIATVEDISNARVGRGIGEHGAVDQEADMGRVGIVIARGEINGMSRWVPVARRPVRQEAFLPVGPQQRV